MSWRDVRSCLVRLDSVSRSSAVDTTGQATGRAPEVSRTDLVALYLLGMIGLILIIATT